jgi:UDP-2,3-diacylglucosamine pyrophosphatase LpxH
VPDVVTVDVTPPTTVLITSDLHFATTRTEASAWAEVEMAQALQSETGPAVLILAGDVFELWAGADPDAAGAMAAHPLFPSAVKEFGQPADRHVICLPGNHDGRLGWDPVAAGVAKGLGARLAFAVELVLPGTGGGGERVRVEHGHRWDPANAFHDPRNALDTPLGQHIVQEILPDLAKEDESGVLAGVESLEDPRTFPSFVASRVFYRRLLKETRWLLVPLVLAVGLHFGIVLLDEPAKLHLRARDFVIFDVAVVLLALVTAGVVVLAGRHAWKGATIGVVDKRGKSQNDNARAAAQQLVQSGYRGMVSGHTHHPELTSFGNGFYANTGSGTKVVEELDARLDLPHVFEARLQLSWVVLRASDAGWAAELHVGGRPVPGTVLERLATPPFERVPSDPSVVASYP